MSSDWRPLELPNEYKDIREAAGVFPVVFDLASDGMEMELVDEWVKC